MTETMNLGDNLYLTMNGVQSLLFDLGEGVQLAYNSFEFMVGEIQNSDKASLTIEYHLGQDAQGRTIAGKREYSKDDLINKYVELAGTGLPLFGLYQLVTITETSLSETASYILKAFPKKISRRKSIPVSSIFEAGSIEEVQSVAISSFLNEMAYKSPREYAEIISEIYGFNILEIPEYHRYVELKATRDIYIHNRGLVNETYRSKAESHARAEVGNILPVDAQYFLCCYETCIRLNELLIIKFLEIWPSLIHEAKETEEQSSSKVDDGKNK